MLTVTLDQQTYCPSSKHISSANDRHKSNYDGSNL